MLTKDLLRFTKRKGRLFPHFIDTSRPDYLSLADRLISVYRKSIGAVEAGEIEEKIAPFLHSTHDLKLAKGLNKLLLDRSVFNSLEETDFFSLRQNLFRVSGQWLKKGIDQEELARAMRHRFKKELVSVENNIYGDLKEFERLVSFDDLSPERLLERYNTSLVQSLLLYSRDLRVRFAQAEAGRVRHVFQRLKFSRMLATLISENNPIEIKIDGPLSLFDHVKKYGLQLAVFFPCLCDLEQWELQTKIHLNGSHLEMHLNQSSGLKNPYRRAPSFFEEFSNFEVHFSKNSGIWKIEKGPSILRLGHQHFAIPDFTFINDRKTKVMLELFHRWHENPLLTRLKWVSEKQRIPYLIGVDRRLYKKSRIKKEVEASKWFDHHGFLFLDFPTVQAVLKRLESLFSTS